MRTKERSHSRERNEAKAKLLVGLLDTKTSNNMTRLYCAMREYRTAETGSDRATLSNSLSEAYANERS